MNEVLIFNIPLFYYFAVLAIILPKIPVIGNFFGIINTALHEFGHALVTLFLQGDVQKIELFGNTAGTTTTKSKSKVTAFFISLAGYPFASTIALGSFYLIASGYNKHLIVGLSFLFFIMLLFWVRNRYGVFWIVLFCTINTILIYFNNSDYINIAALFYGTVIFVESTFSTVVLLYLSIVKPKEAGDASNLKKLTHIPAFIWALLFAGYAGFVVYQVVIRYLM